MWLRAYLSFPVDFVRRDSFTPLSESRLPTDVPSRRRSSGMTEAKGSVPNCQDFTVQGCGPESTGISIIWISCLKYGFPGSPRGLGSGVHTGAWAFACYMLPCSGWFWCGRLGEAYRSQLEKLALQMCGKGPFLEAFDSSEEKCTRNLDAACNYYNVQSSRFLFMLEAQFCC